MYNAGVGQEVIKLRQPDVCDIDSDKKLFEFLKEDIASCVSDGGPGSHYDPSNHQIR